tara:strand:- start:1316 stop:2833 length:1518 start_codon:yes stop_codon:yes gene_type:complete
MLHNDLKFYSNKTPGKVAIISNEKSYTYGELWLDCNKIANWINSNLDCEAKVGIMLENCIESVLAVFGVSIAGFISVPLDSDIHERNLQFIIKDSSIKLIITSSEYIKRIEKINSTNSLFIVYVGDFIPNNKYYHFDKMLSLDNDENLIGKNVSVFDTAAIFYTTGTTGPKKGVELSHQNLIATTTNINEFMKIGSWAIESLPMRLSHSFGFGRIRCVFQVGGTIILENGFLRPEILINNMLKYKANGISSVPLGFVILLEYYNDFFKKLSHGIKYIEIGSASMKNKHKKMLMKLCPTARICMHYGLTEASRSTFIEFNSEKNKLNTIGKPSPNVEVKIVNKKYESVELNEVGEIIVKGPNVMKGYLNKSDLSNKYINNSWFRTDDFGSMDSDGYVQFFGRKKEIINIRGFMVAPIEVENVLMKYDGVKQAAVVGIKSNDKLSDKMIKAFIVIDNDNLSLDDLKTYSIENLEPYKVPESFEIINSIPVTSSGKIQRNLLENINRQ